MNHSLKLYDFQEKALEELIAYSKIGLRFGKNKLLLKAPTGSGKTIIMGSYIDQMLEEYEDITFVWLCETPNLTLQSKRKLEKHFNLKTFTVDEARIESELINKVVTFINWEVIKDNRVGTITGDTTTSLVDLCKGARENGKKIVFIIDEAHTNANSVQSLKQTELAAPDLIIDVTATPNEKRVINEIVEIDIKDVQKEEIVKKSVVINYEQDLYNEYYRKKHKINTFKEFILNHSLLLRDKMEDEIKKFLQINNEKNYVPLLLIQLPPVNKKERDELKEEVLAFLKSKGYERDKNVAVYESIDYSDDLEKIGENEEYKVLLFKNAIAKGWDCPRASILAMLRDPKTKSFTTQTIGRILRVPRLKYFPQDLNWLNKGYIYIESSENQILNEYQNSLDKNEGISSVQNGIKAKFSNNIVKLKMKKWNIEYEEKIDELNKIKKEMEKTDWIKELPLSRELIKENMTGEYNPGKLEGENLIKKETVDMSLRDKIIQYEKDIQGMGIEGNILNEIIIEKLADHYSDNDLLIYQAIWSNKDKVISEYRLLERKYKTPKRISKIDKTWVPETTRDEKPGLKVGELSKNYLYKECYGKFNGLERKLAETLTNSNKIEYWIRNLDSGPYAFSVPYKINGRFASFHPDFIVKSRDTIYILETKGQNDKEESQEKQRALKDWQYECTENGNIIVGFIKEFKDQLYIYTNDNFEKEYDDIGKWKRFEI
ncbi:hypothetical protein C1N61_32515 (plasmid) [Priestia aryabhattai]